MHLARVAIGLLTAGAVAIGATAAARAQPAPSGPISVGVVEATKRPITETSEFLGRIEATNRVNVVARVSAFLEKRLFNEGAEIKKGDELYRLERGPEPHPPGGLPRTSAGQAQSGVGRVPVGRDSIAVSIEPRWISRASLITDIFIDVTGIKIW